MTMTFSLLEQAKKYSKPDKRVKKYSEQELEVVEAWLNDEITMVQVAAVVKISSPSGAYQFLATGSKLVWAKRGRTNKTNE